MQRRDFLIRSTSLAALACFPAFGAQNFTIYGAPAMITLPLAYARHHGQARKVKDFSLRVWNSPDELRAGFVSGSYQLSCAPMNVGVILAHKGLNIKLLSVLTNGLNYILSRNDNIKELKDLEGKKLIIPFKNDLPDFVFSALCDKLGVKKSKIDIHYVQTPPQAAQLFVAKGEFDAVLSQEPFSSAVTLLGKKHGVKVQRAIDMQALFKASFGVGVKQAGMVVNGEFYAKNQSFFEALSGDLTEAVEWIKSHETSAASLGARYLPAPEPAIKMAIRHSNLIYAKAGEVYAELNEFYKIIFAQNRDFLGGRIPSRELFL